MEHINWQLRRDILICIICIGVILWTAWNIAGQFVDVIVILLLSMAVAFLLSPLVDFLTHYRVPRIFSTLIVYVLVLAILSSFGYALIFSLIQQILSFSQTIVNFATALPDKFSAFINFLHTQGGIPQANIDTALSQIQSQVTAFAQAAASNTLNIALIVTNAFINILLVIVLSFYLTLDGKRIRDSIISIVPRRSLDHALLFEDALNRVVGNYIRGQLTLAVIIGVLAGGGYWVIGGIEGRLQSYALIIGVLAFLFETIPMVGPALASIPAITLSLLLPEPFPRTFWVIVYFVVIQVVESNILGPSIVGHAVGLHPVASLLALILGAKLFGAFGALLATPIVAASWVVVSSIYRSAKGETADQMLARRRTSWGIRRPRNLHPIHTREKPLVSAAPSHSEHDEPATTSKHDA